MWYWKIGFWVRRNDGGWMLTGYTPFFRGDVQKAEVEHYNSYDESGADATTLLYWWGGVWVKYEELP